MLRLFERLDALAAPSDRWLSAMLVAAGAIGLGYGLQISNGTLNPQAINLLIFTLGAATLAVASPRLGFFEKWADTPAAIVLGAGLVVGLSVHYTTMPGVYLGGVAQEDMLRHHYLLAALAVLAGAGLSKAPWLGWLRTLLFLGFAFMLGLWLLKASPNPFIDVFVWHNEAFAALGRFENPYGITMPNIYGTTNWFAPGLADAAHVFVGYPYPPVALGIGGLGHLAVNDYRYANLVALIISSGLIAFSRPGRVSATAAAILLLSPRSLFVLEQGWTESLSILALCGTVFCACRAPRLLPWVFGAMLATKQYFVLCAPLAILLLPRPLSLRQMVTFTWKALVIPAVTILPFFLWSPKAFLDSVVYFQARQPFRPDSLSFMAWTMKDGVPELPLWTGFFALIPAYILAWLRVPRTPFGFAASSALMFLLFFAFSKQAFCNYYFLIVGTLCCAAGAASPSIAAVLAQPVLVPPPAATIDPLTAPHLGSAGP